SMIFLGIASASLGFGPRFFSRISAPVFCISFNYTCKNKKSTQPASKKICATPTSVGGVYLCMQPHQKPLFSLGRQTPTKSPQQQLQQTTLLRSVLFLL